MNIIYVDKLSVDLCRAQPDHVFVFGDNLAGYGKGGQAVIRYEMNAFGIPTKRYPSMAAGSFFTDQNCEREHVLKALRDLYCIAKQRTIVFPSKGVGTGMAKMPESSPKIFSEMNEILLKHLGIKNG